MAEYVGEYGGQLLEPECEDRVMSWQEENPRGV